MMKYFFAILLPFILFIFLKIETNIISRCYDYELPCMLRLKNKPRAVIVVYDDDESIASKAATTLTQRGYDNVFMLSGNFLLHFN